MGVVVIPTLRGRFTEVVLHEHRVDVIDVGRVAVVLRLDVAISDIGRRRLGVDGNRVVVLQGVDAGLGPDGRDADSRARRTRTGLLRCRIGHVTIRARLACVGRRSIELARDVCI